MAWFVRTVVGTTLGGLLPNPEIFGPDFALVGITMEFYFAIPDYTKTVPVHNHLLF